MGIGHTRWATHGEPSETNAHPHTAGRVAVVHNGIIENYRELRARLEAEGRELASDTDTEVVPHLIDSLMERGLDPEAATAEALAQLEGAFALAIIFAGHTDLLIGARRGSPLAIGHADDAAYLASDALALAPFTRRISYLDEGDWAVLRGAKVTVREASGRPVQRPLSVTAHDGAMIGKGNYRHYMLKEIFEQPGALGDTLGAYYNPGAQRIALPALPFALERVDKVTIVACGTSYYAGLAARYWIEQTARVPVDIDIASEFRYRMPPLEKDSAALFISQSGETADTLAALRFAKQAARPRAAVVNVRESTMAREADAVLPTHAGVEIGVASTKAFTAQLVTLACFAIALARARGAIDGAEEARLAAALAHVPAQAAQVLGQDERIRALAGTLRQAATVLYIGRGTGYPHRHGGRAQAQGALLHPCRGFCCRRAQARPHRAHRPGRAGDRRGAARPALRQDRVQPAGGRRPRRPCRRHRRPGRLRDAGAAGRGRHRAAGTGPLRRAHPLRHPGPAHRLPRGGAQGDRRGSAPQPREIRDRGMSEQPALIDLDDDHRELREPVRALCARYPGEYWRAKDREREYPGEFVQALTDAGFLAALIPERYGGSGLGIGAAAAILEEIHASGCNGGACHAQMYTMGTLLRHGSAAQKQAYLPQIASGARRLQAFGVTEPTTGSDTTQLRTTAEKRPDGDYTVNGQKVWISRAEHSDLLLLLARTTPAAETAKRTEGLSVFLVELEHAVGKGLEIRPIRTMINHATTELFFDDLVIPAASLIGEEGRGFRYILDGMNAERILIAAECIGDCRWFIEKASRLRRRA